MAFSIPFQLWSISLMRPPNISIKHPTHPYTHPKWHLSLRFYKHSLPIGKCLFTTSGPYWWWITFGFPWMYMMYETSTSSRDKRRTTSYLHHSYNCTFVSYEGKFVQQNTDTVRHTHREQNNWNLINQWHYVSLLQLYIYMLDLWEFERLWKQ